MNRKPELSFRQIWNMCFGFLGIQFGFAGMGAGGGGASLIVALRVRLVEPQAVTQQVA